MNPDPLPLYETPARDRWRAAAKLAYALAQAQLAVRVEIQTKESYLEIAAALGHFNPEVVRAHAAAALAEVDAEVAVRLLSLTIEEYEASRLRVTI